MLHNRILDAHQAPRESRAGWLKELRKKPTRSKSWQLEHELTDLIRALALLTKNGVPIHVALGWLGPRTKGKIGPLVDGLNRELELAAGLEEALSWFASEIGGQLAEELVQKVLVSQSRGTPLADQLEQLAASSRAASAARLMSQAGRSETKMLIPTIFVVLPVTVLFAIYPSLSLLSGQF